jgi:hypothetical protein
MYVAEGLGIIDGGDEGGGGGADAEDGAEAMHARISTVRCSIVASEYVSGPLCCVRGTATRSSPDQPLARAVADKPQV